MDPVESLRPLLPAWIGLAPAALWLPAAWVIAGGTAGLAWRITSVPLRALPSSSPWFERARASQPARLAVAFAAWLAAGVLGALAAHTGGPFSATPSIALGAAVFAIAYLGGLEVRARCGRALGLPSDRIAVCAADDLVACVLLLPHLLLALAAAPWIRAPLDAIDALLLAAVAFAFVAIARGGALGALGWIGRLRPVPERLLRCVRAAADAAGQPVPAVAVLDWSMANAFAFPLGGRLAFTQRAIEVLDDAGLSAIAAHELGHLAEPRAVRVARAGALFALLPLAGTLAALELAGALGALALLAGVVALLLAFRSVASRMERRADRAALDAQAAPGDYARALERLYQANLEPAVALGRPLHGHLYERLLAAGVAPDYPRPDPPSRARLRAALALSIAWLIVGATVLAGLPILWGPAAVQHEGASNLVIALSPGSDPLLRRALLEEYRGRADRALAFARAAAALEPERHEADTLVATALGRRGRCEEAAAHLALALARAPGGADDPWVVAARASVEACAAPARPVSSARSRA